LEHQISEGEINKTKEAKEPVFRCLNAENKPALDKNT
jgi:hypothetical protein